MDRKIIIGGVAVVGVVVLIALGYMFRDHIFKKGTPAEAKKE